MPHLYDAVAKGTGLLPSSQMHSTTTHVCQAVRWLLKCRHVAFKHANVNAGSDCCGLCVRLRILGGR